MGTWKRHSQQELNKELFLVYGHGDGGGGPTREMLENIRRMERGIPGCPAVLHGTMGGFFGKLLARMAEEPENFPVWVGELYLEFHRGTLTSVAKNKRNNRKAELKLRELEALASHAMATKGVDYPCDRLHALWRIVLLNQFHDILPGSSIGGVYEDSDRDYARFFEEAESLHKELVSGFASEDSYLVFNPLGNERDELVRIAAAQPLSLSKDDETIPTQSLFCADGHIEQGTRLGPIPAMGGFILKAQTGTSPEAGNAFTITTQCLENARLKVLFDEKGRITSLFDKQKGREAIIPGQVGNRLQAYRDMPPQYDAWDIDSDFESQIWEIDDLVSAEIVERGPYRAAVRFEWHYEHSRIVQILALEADSCRLDVDCHIDWHEHHTLLKVAFPVNVATTESVAEIQFGHVSRPSHSNTTWDQARFETLMHRWVALSEADFGLALLNDCKYGYDAKDTTLRLTLLRSPRYPWPEADQGAHDVRYGLVVHDGLFEGQNVPAQAEAFNMPLCAIKGQTPMLVGNSGHSAPLSLLSVDGGGVGMECVKKADKADALIVRLCERHGRQSQARLTLPDKTRAIAEVDLLEENPETIALEGSGLDLVFRPFEIRTFMIKI